jgi:hypothetical protein
MLERRPLGAVSRAVNARHDSNTTQTRLTPTYGQYRQPWINNVKTHTDIRAIQTAVDQQRQRKSELVRIRPIKGRSIKASIKASVKESIKASISRQASNHRQACASFPTCASCPPARLATCAPCPPARLARGRGQACAEPVSRRTGCAFLCRTSARVRRLDGSSPTLRRGGSWRGAQDARRATCARRSDDAAFLQLAFLVLSRFSLI